MDSETAEAPWRLTAIKLLVSFGKETGYLSFNVRAAVKLRPSPGLARSAHLEKVAKLIEAARTAVTGFIGDQEKRG